MNPTNNYSKVDVIVFKKNMTGQLEASTSLLEARVKVCDPLIKTLGLDSYQLRLIDSQDEKDAVARAAQRVKQSTAFATILDVTELEYHIDEDISVDLGIDPREKITLTIACADTLADRGVECNLNIDWLYNFDKNGVITTKDQFDIQELLFLVLAHIFNAQADVVDDVKKLIGDGNKKGIVDIISLFRCAVIEHNLSLIKTLLPLLPKKGSADIKEWQWQILQEAMENCFTRVAYNVLEETHSPDKGTLMAQIIKDHWDSYVTKLSPDAQILTMQNYMNAVALDLVGSYEENYNFIRHALTSILKTELLNGCNSDRLTYVYRLLGENEHTMIAKAVEKCNDVFEHAAVLESPKYVQHLQGEIKYLTEANRYSPNDYKILYLLASAYGEIGNYKYAKVVIKKCLFCLDNAKSHGIDTLETKLTYVYSHLLAHDIYASLNKSKKAKQHSKMAQKMISFLMEMDYACEF